MAQNHIIFSKDISLLKISFYLLLMIFCSAALTACANHAARTQELLSENYQSLSNDDLTLYFYNLEDQIDLVENHSTSPRVNLGFGLSHYGFSSGSSGGVGVSTGGNRGGVATDLRKRRNEVKLELQKRGITPD